MTSFPNRRGTLLALPGLALLGGCGPVVGAVLPESPLPALPGLVGPNGWPLPGFAADEFRRGVSLLNVWASWCPYCQGEHEHLIKLSRDGRFRMLGLVYQDKAEKAVSYLRRAGNPFGAVARDDGQLSAALGQRGVPASYVVARSGRVLAKIAGALDEGSIAGRIMPAIRAGLDGRDTAAG